MNLAGDAVQGDVDAVLDGITLAEINAALGVLRDFRSLLEGNSNQKLHQLMKAADIQASTR